MIEPSNAVAAQPAAPAQTTATALGQLGSDAFLKLLITQLKYQNPMNPMDGAAMMQQTAQLTTVETLQAISETNQRLMGFQQVTMALAVVGKPVSALSPDGIAVEGTVESLRFTVDGPLLRLDNGIEISMDSVFTVGGGDVGAFELLPPVEEPPAPADPVASDSAVPETEVPEVAAPDEVTSSTEPPGAVTPGVVTPGAVVPEVVTPEAVTPAPVIGPDAGTPELVVPDVAPIGPEASAPAASEIGVPDVAAP